MKRSIKLRNILLSLANDVAPKKNDNWIYDYHNSRDAQVITDFKSSFTDSFQRWDDNYAINIYNFIKKTKIKYVEEAEDQKLINDINDLIEWVKDKFVRDDYTDKKEEGQKLQNIKTKLDYVKSQVKDIRNDNLYKLLYSVAGKLKLVNNTNLNESFTLDQVASLLCKSKKDIESLIFIYNHMSDEIEDEMEIYPKIYFTKIKLIKNNQNLFVKVISKEDFNNLNIFIDNIGDNDFKTIEANKIKDRGERDIIKHNTLHELGLLLEDGDIINEKECVRLINLNIPFIYTEITNKFGLMPDSEVKYILENTKENVLLSLFKLNLDYDTREAIYLIAKNKKFNLYEYQKFETLKKDSDSTVEEVLKDFYKKSGNDDLLKAYIENENNISIKNTISRILIPRAIDNKDDDLIFKLLSNLNNNYQLNLSYLIEGILIEYPDFCLHNKSSWDFIKNKIKLGELIDPYNPDNKDIIESFIKIFIKIEGNENLSELIEIISKIDSKFINEIVTTDNCQYIIDNYMSNIYSIYFSKVFIDKIIANELTEENMISLLNELIPGQIIDSNDYRSKLILLLISKLSKDEKNYKLIEKFYNKFYNGASEDFKKLIIENCDHACKEYLLSLQPNKLTAAERLFLLQKFSQKSWFDSAKETAQSFLNKSKEVGTSLLDSGKALIDPPKPAESQPKASPPPPVSLPSKANGPTGSQFAQELTSLPPNDKREQAIADQILKGNFPQYMRKLVPITVAKGNTSITYDVMPDYLSVGTDQDSIRVPINPLTAQKIADQMGFTMPTKKMVDQIWQKADTKLAPQPLSGGTTINGKYYSGKDFTGSGKMMDSESFIEHNKRIQEQLNGQIPTGLVAGHKKDVIVSDLNKPSHVAIYGWHSKDGKPIQGIGLGHENTYKDYSHGIRFVAKTVTVTKDGVTKKMSMEDVLKDPELAPLVSDEGALKRTSYAVPAQPKEPIKDPAKEPSKEFTSVPEANLSKQKEKSQQVTQAPKSVQPAGSTSQKENDGLLDMLSNFTSTLDGLSKGLN